MSYLPSSPLINHSSHLSFCNNSSQLTLQPSIDKPAMASEPDLNLFPINLVQKTMAPPEDDLAFIEQMLNGPQVFIHTDPFIYDGPIPSTPPSASQRRLASVMDH